MRFLKSKSTLPQRKSSTPFRGGIPDFRQTNRKLGGNIGYFERTFVQDFKNIREKNTSFGCSRTLQATRLYNLIKQLYKIMV